MFKKFTLAATAIALGSAPVLGGSPEPAYIEPEVAVPVSTSPDWTGFYVGAQVGFANIDATTGNSGDGLIGGIVGGYDWDLGNWVVGAGADYDFADIGVGVTDVESIWRLRLRGGYKLGNGLAYGTAGYAHADTDNAGDDGGYFVGLGYEHLVTQSFSLGAEVLYHEFDSFGLSTADLEATTVQLRGTYRF